MTVFATGIALMLFLGYLYSLPVAAAADDDADDDAEAPNWHLAVPAVADALPAVVGLDGAVIDGTPARCPTCEGVIILDGPIEGPSAELACAMHACPRRAGAAECGGRLW